MIDESKLPDGDTMPSNFEKLIDTVICQLSHWKNREAFNRLRKENSNNYSLEGFDRLKCIYVHIPKAAGISINKALFGNYGGGHKTVRAYKRIFGPMRYNRYFTFTFVRNPYSRLLSAYRFLINGGFKDEEGRWAEQNISGYDHFDEFVKKWVNEETIWTYNHFKPQFSFVCDIGMQPEVDFVGKVETIDDDFDKVCKILKVQNNLSVHNRSKADNSDWKQYYTPYTLQKVADIYHHDFDIFNYQQISE